MAFGQDSLPLGKARAGVVHGHARPENCALYTETAQRVINSIPGLPSSHRWMVACSLEVWNAALKKGGHWGRTNTAFTAELGEVTVINGAVFEEEGWFYRRVIGHEAGHISCRCSNEEKAEAEGNRLLKAANQKKSEPVSQNRDVQPGPRTANASLGSDKTQAAPAGQ